MRTKLIAGARLIVGIAIAVFCVRGVETAVSREQVEGQALAAELCALQPSASATNAAILELRDANGRRTRIPLTIVTRLSENSTASWSTTYTTRPANSTAGESLTIQQLPAQAPTYARVNGGGSNPEIIAAGQSFVPFANSDFWISDLGLEFLHWPEHRILPGPRGDPPMVKGRSCKVLESRAPPGSPYSRVVSWIDHEFKSIIQADAYDSSGRLLKKFSVGSFKKIDGVWQLKDMEMIDERRDTKTKLEFELKVRER